MGFVQPLIGQRILQQAVRGHRGDRRVEDLWGFGGCLLLPDDAGDGIVVKVVVRLGVDVERVGPAALKLGCVCCNLHLLALLGQEVDRTRLLRSSTGRGRIWTDRGWYTELGSYNTL